METLRTKQCPFCSEEILETAKKCKFCNEIIDVTMMRSTAPIPAKAKSGGKGLAMTSMILGILSLLTLVFGVVPGILAIIFGYCAKKAMRRIGNYSGQRMAMAGITCGIIAVVFTTIVLCFAMFGRIYSTQTSSMSKPTIDDQITADAEKYAKKSFEGTKVVYKRIGGVRKTSSKDDYEVVVVVDLPDGNDRVFILEIEMFKDTYTIGWDTKSTAILAALKLAGQ